MVINNQLTELQIKHPWLNLILPDQIYKDFLWWTILNEVSEQIDDSALEAEKDFGT